MVLLKKLIFFNFILILFLSLVSATPQIKINIAPVFYEGDTIEFSYEIFSFENQAIKYFAGIDCGEDNPQAMLELKEIYLKANEPFQGDYNFGELNSLYMGKNCTASINILEPFQIFKSKSFEISTSPLFTFELNFPKKVFLLNENINLDYTSDVSSLNIDATLKYPNGNSENINLPTTIKAEQIGTYELNVQASKEGYKDVELKEQFAVIEGNVEIGQVESVKDIPNNLEKGEDKKISNLIWILILLGILLFILIIFVIYFILKEKNI